MPQVQYLRQGGAIAPVRARLIPPNDRTVRALVSPGLKGPPGTIIGNYQALATLPILMCREIAKTTETFWFPGAGPRPASQAE